MNSILYCAVEKPMWHLINSKTFGKHACLVQPCFTAHAQTESQSSGVGRGAERRPNTLQPRDDHNVSLI